MCTNVRNRRLTGAVGTVAVAFFGCLTARTNKDSGHDSPVYICLK